MQVSTEVYSTFCKQLIGCHFISLNVFPCLDDVSQPVIDLIDDLLVLGFATEFPND